jgi:hypothetical protein
VAIVYQNHDSHGAAYQSPVGDFCNLSKSSFAIESVFTFALTVGATKKKKKKKGNWWVGVVVKAPVAQSIQKMLRVREKLDQSQLQYEATACSAGRSGWSMMMFDRRIE